MSALAARIFQLNVSPGGVPKRAVASAALTPLGLEGDSVRHPKIHGGPTRALCLFSLERILALQEEGGSLFPGALGENVTIVGLDWDRVVPGARLELGDALVEVTSYAEPCRTTTPYVCGDRKRFQQEHRPGWSRVYASVHRTATLAPGMPVRLV
ncbi:MAG TPA: MOSC domain-containing protein [Candidatus Thermoplasmatota archaeon]|nr:MOSC domain-containing protein [Candidatus Thermoplasmatota archaeon]